ncbi:hypothetical protein [Paramagnetospirillum marisnigri]|uniref:hypothetical protein n=1 Tax=Paramagnetospirillum marisnigri TaxID=1285242 RepID=UPI0012E9509F|nr:hypothetical protein [Paramagnetospirillum marisnigri]
MLIVTRSDARKAILLAALLCAFAFGSISQAIAQQNRLPASDDPGRIERRFPSPADALKDPYAPTYIDPVIKGNCCLPFVLEKKPGEEAQQPDIILLPPSSEGEKK